MEARYEIREKIGQGGMGSVYRAYDTRMGREVAIKRIQQEGEATAQQAASEQIVKEAGALALLQHPHIVTVYDVGADEEGPYVVMELISGKTLDELIERAPLTWPDFRELALQTQEALIAAHELNLVHRDLKPSNLMLTWLPSGKFQVKIVDFGLAKLVHSSALDHLETADAVLGSIFFMCPEQFERAILDARADMYSIGCVYYHALAGSYPFDGTTGMQVMTAHLDHQVTPLQEVRPDIPRWACDWVMWHINRHASDRPADARESLKVFLQNDKPSTPLTSTPAIHPASEPPKRPRLIIPGAAPQPATQPLAPPEGSRPSVYASPSPEPIPAPAPPPPVVIPKPAAPAPAPHLAALAKTAATAAARPAPGRGVAVHPGPSAATQAMLTQPVTHKKPALTNGTKGAIAAVLGLLMVLLTVAIVRKSGSSKREAAYNRLVQLATEEEAKGIPVGQKIVPVTRKDLDVLLNAVIAPRADEERQTLLHALWWAKANDSTDVDARIVEFATKQTMPGDIRVSLMRDVLKNRRTPAVVPSLMEYCRTSSDTKAATAAIEACREMATETDLPKLIELVTQNPNADVRRTAAEIAAEILKKSPTREALGDKVATALTTATNSDVRCTLVRLLGTVGGSKSADLVRKSLGSSNKKEQFAAAEALGGWPDDSMFRTLMEFLDSLTDEQLRSRVFDVAFHALALPDHKRTSETAAAFWQALAASAKTSAEQEKVIQGLSISQSDAWAISIIKRYIAESTNDKIIELAKKALERIRERATLKGGNP